MYNLIDIVCIMSGGYLVYSALSMKSKGEIIANVVLNKSVNENAIKDKKGYIDYIYGKLLWIGIIIILSGVVDIVNVNMGGSFIISVAAIIVFALSLVAYGKVAKTALEKFT